MDLKTNPRKRRLLEEAVSSTYTPPSKRDVATHTEDTRPMTMDMYTQTDHSPKEELVLSRDYQNQINQIFNILKSHQDILGEIRDYMCTVAAPSDSGHETSPVHNVNYTIVTNGDNAISIEPVKPEDIIEEPVSSPMRFSEEQFEVPTVSTSTTQAVRFSPAPPTLINSNMYLYQNAHCSKSNTHEIKTEQPPVKTPKAEHPTIIKRCPLADRTAEPGNSQQQDGHEMVPIGPNQTLVPKSVLDSIKWNSASGATRKLLTTVFTREELATHSLTGRPSPAFHGRDKPAKNQLDPAKVADIIHIVTQCCNVSEKEVRNSITTKCADENKMYNQRLRRLENKENVKCNLTL